MKILIANYSSDTVGGAEIAIANLIENTPKDIEVISWVSKDGNLSNYYKSKNISTHVQYISNPRRKYPGLHFVSSLLFVNYLKKNQIDIVLCNTFPAIYKMMTACKIAKVKMGVYLRDHPSHPEELSHILNKCDFIYAVSDSIKDYFQPFCKENIIKINDWIDVQGIIVKSKQEIKFKFDNNINIAQIGRIQSIKQQHLFIDNILDITKEYPMAKFFIVGEASNNKRDQDYLNMLKQKIEENNITQNIVFTGFIKNIEAFISNMDIVVLPSKNEAFPRTILECQIIGVPIICNNVGGCIEMIKDGESGLFVNLIDNNGSKEITEKVLSILNNTALRDKLISGGKKSIKKHYITSDLKDFFYKNIRSLI